MTRMDCSEVRDLLAAYLDDELPAGERLSIAGHLGSCPDCGRALADLEALGHAVRMAGTFAEPAGLEARLRARIGLEDARDRRPVWQRLGALAASHVFVAILAGALGAAVVWHQMGLERALHDVVSSHVRSTLTGEPVQVASSDSHTVKPWFAGRLPFSPPVHDLANQGYPLIGGRLDRIFDKTVAVLVYGRRLHRINVFVVPAMPLGADALPKGIRDGYNVTSWRVGGFVFLAVSELNREELENFARRLQEAS